MMTRYYPLLLSCVLAACAGTDDGRDFVRPDAGDAGDESDIGGANNGANNGAGDMGNDGANNGVNNGANNGADDMGDNLCQPNRDGTIERGEVPIQAGLAATFAIAEDVEFNTAGSVEDGTTVWDLTDQFPGERRDLIELRSPAGQWWETSFPDATYFTELSGQSDLLGVFRTTDEAVELLGVVSPEDGFYKTEVEYDPPVPVLKFPLKAGTRWTVEADVSGMFNGVFTAYTESYVFDADKAGELHTPYANFDVIRVRSTLDRTVGFVETRVRSFAFVAECFGTVGTITSQENEDDAEFTDVLELRRLAP